MDDKVLATVTALHEALRVIELATELRAQTQRFRNVLTSTDLDSVTGNACQVVKVLNSQLQRELNER